MRFPFLFKILIALLPLITALLIILYYVLKDVKGEVLLRKVIKNTSKTMIDVKVQGDAVEDEEKKRNHIFVYQKTKCKAQCRRYNL